MPSGASRPPKFSLTPHWFSQKYIKNTLLTPSGFTANRLLDKRKGKLKFLILMVMTMIFVFIIIIIAIIINGY